MNALVRYLLADVLRSQRFLAPVMVFLAVLGMLYASDAGVPLVAYAGSCVLIYPVAVWLTVVVATAEDPVRRSVTVVAAGGWGRVQGAVAVSAALCACLLALVATGVPVLTQSRPYPPEVVAQGFGAHLVCGLTGVGVGLLCARPVITRLGWGVLAATALVVLPFPLGRVPPVGSVLGALNDQRDVLPVLLVSGACALALLVIATLTATRLGPRRG
ncbi:hypothetical protein JOF41_003250 [Saccharothrix coeruleofusca]|uniref:hypothetical protein n=1 Tax=Saccharothrix coeruleofusca TaxID=33919 RepID=UPI001AEAB47A|nr:hypothetical protein [Saccharothrix coeruleofusca]MBP2337072.1 hypothetical protein [Saccharothrix coeruleofusca]